MAISNPDEYAWQLFFFLNRQAMAGNAGHPDARKKFGQLDGDAPVVWESWARESDPSEVFLPNAAKPDDWNTWLRKDNLLRLDVDFEQQMIFASQTEDKFQRSRRRTSNRKTRIGHVRIKITKQPPENLAKVDEVRMNEAAYKFLVDNALYSTEGLKMKLSLAQQNKDRSTISFPRGAKEVKAHWVPIQEADEARYFWRKGITDTGKKQIYGLAALHIITKDLLNWFWADFGHVDCETGERPCQDFKAELDWQSISGCPACACDGSKPDQTGFANHLVDRTTNGPNGTPGPHGLNGIRNETRRSVWENYRLRGAQTDFTSSTGTPTFLSNPVLEKDHQRSSCITCHALAAYPMNDVQVLIGLPCPDLFGINSDPLHPEIKKIQTDFMWTVAQRPQSESAKIKR